ncbi:urease accessory protein [Litoreibacter ponti]|uniref:Urease accessory protein UreE n=1 Tax=Litoreibacter ponti TaxID=1510457 RepID=A0A2T6BHV3_9RHOB|nr:urease accessory protein UreE [Litoreibacter ponti]PTX55640.1 urease accessory protein [Litoreibacter ponti]
MSAPLPVAREVVRDAGAGDARIALTYDARLLRRKRLTAAEGLEFLADFERAESLRHGDGFSLDDGRVVVVEAAPEAVLEITGDLTRLAWHIGNRHTPCEISDTALYIAEDPVLHAMLEQLGAHVHRVTRAFSPEGGAYGHGRTFGHSHDHSHD